MLLSALLPERKCQLRPKVLFRIPKVPLINIFHSKLWLFNETHSACQKGFKCPTFTMDLLQSPFSDGLLALFVARCSFVYSRCENEPQTFPPNPSWAQQGNWGEANLITVFSHHSSLSLFAWDFSFVSIKKPIFGLRRFWSPKPMESFKLFDVQKYTEKVIELRRCGVAKLNSPETETWITLSDEGLLRAPLASLFYRWSWCCSMKAQLQTFQLFSLLKAVNWFFEAPDKIRIS